MGRQGKRGKGGREKLECVGKEGKGKGKERCRDELMQGLIQTPNQSGRHAETMQPDILVYTTVKQVCQA